MPLCQGQLRSLLFATLCGFASLRQILNQGLTVGPVAVYLIRKTRRVDKPS